MSRPSVAARLADDRHRPELKSPPGFTEGKAENSSIYARYSERAGINRFPLKASAS
jgi:hypothetical protein